MSFKSCLFSSSVINPGTKGRGRELFFASIYGTYFLALIAIHFENLEADEHPFPKFALVILYFDFLDIRRKTLISVISRVPTNFPRIILRGLDPTFTIVGNARL